MSNLKCDKIEYGGWQNCLRLSNGSIDVVATTDVGPRIIRCGFAGEPNLFFEAPGDMGKTGGNGWRPYGGHRLWHAPEMKPRTYAPDNSAIEHKWDGTTLSLLQPVEPSTGIRKEMHLRMQESGNRLQVVHRLTNENHWEIETAAWCLSVMAPGGRAILPQEPFTAFPHKLLPARPLVLWAYTNMADPRFRWGTRSVQLRQDPKASDCQKFGVMNTPGWGAYQNDGSVFVKRVAYHASQEYPDFGCNWEVYTNAAMLEMETLSPLTKLGPGKTIEHTENWMISKAPLPEAEVEMMAELEALVKEFPVDSQ